MLILADDLGFNDVSLAGGADATLATPSIDSLANEGVMFANGYAGNASCLPSRAALMTGRYPTRFGVEFTPFHELGGALLRWMPTPEPHAALPVRVDREGMAAMPDTTVLGVPAEEVTMAEVLKAAGYYTAHIGKWHLGGQSGLRPEDQGFDDSLYMGGAGALYLPHDHPDAVNARLPNLLDRGGWAGSHFEGGLHVPLVARWPARIAPGSIFDDPVHQMDLFHTFSAAAGATVPQDRVLDGVWTFCRSSSAPPMACRTGRCFGVKGTTSPCCTTAGS